MKELELKFEEISHKYNSLKDEKEYETKEFKLKYDECVNVSKIKDKESSENKSK